MNWLLYKQEGKGFSRISRQRWQCDDCHEISADFMTTVWWLPDNCMISATRLPWEPEKLSSVDGLWVIQKSTRFCASQYQLILLKYRGPALHWGRNCLNLFQTTADADPWVSRVSKDGEEYWKFNFFCHFYSAPEWLKVKEAFGYDHNKQSPEANDGKLLFWNQPEIGS